MEMQIRLASSQDADQVLSLLRDIAALHRAGRPDLFREGGSKYTKQELLKLFESPSTPVFVAIGEEGRVLGYAFCQLTEHRNDSALCDGCSLYLDDLCVDSSLRGQGIGQHLFDHVVAFAKQKGCHNLDLNVWEFNDAARHFYEKQGMHLKKRCLELILDQPST